MRDSWHKYMSLGYVHTVAFPNGAKGEGPIKDQVAQLLADDAYRAVEVSWVKDPEEREKLAEFLAEADVDVVFLTSFPMTAHGVYFCDLSEEGRQAAVELGKKLIDEAYLYGARMMLVGSGPDPGSEKRAEGLKQLAKSLGELCSYARSKAKDHVLTITLEHFDREIDKKFLLGPTAETAAFIRELRQEHDNLGITLDQSHLYQLGEDAEESARLAGECIVHAHFANCIVKDSSHALYGDKHTPFSVPGGEVGPEQIARFLEALAKSGYFSRPQPTRRPVVSLEVNVMSGEGSPEEIIQATKEAFLKGWELADLGIAPRFEV